MKKYIPNSITALNLFSGCIGIVMVMHQEFLLAFYCVLASGIFDFFDGLSARALRVKSNIGKELDSLADVVSFGFLPGAVLFMMMGGFQAQSIVPYLGFLVTVFSALRLAKFNVDSRQATDFIGVNTPMNTFVIIALPFIAQRYAFVDQIWVLLIITALSSFLLVSEIRLFSMKMENLSWIENRYKYIFLGIGLIGLVAGGFLALPFILLLYIAFSKLHFSQKTP
ncbi:MAG: CDP-alcohol phosphatidyltransferase family protein [Sphingobacterium sp.]